MRRHVAIKWTALDANDGGEKRSCALPRSGLRGLSAARLALRFTRSNSLRRDDMCVTVAATKGPRSISTVNNLGSNAAAYQPDTLVANLTKLSHCDR